MVWLYCVNLAHLLLQVLALTSLVAHLLLQAIMLTSPPDGIIHDVSVTVGNKSLNIF